MTPRALAKRALFLAATLAVLPQLLSFAIRARLMGRDRALHGSSQALSLVPGLLGIYLRRAFYARVLAACDESATIEFGTLFSKAGARIDADAYVGPHCHIGLAHIGRDVLLAAGVHVPSGGRIHGTDDLTRPIREQPGEATLVTIGPGSWVGSGAVVMADVGRDSIIGAGAVVTKPIPALVFAGGIPARVLKSRGAKDAAGESPPSAAAATTPA